MSTSPADQQQLVDTALVLGARHLDIGQRRDEPHVVLADPDGNEFCVIEPSNAFLAGCGPIGALACDGLQRVGYFWSQALGWPLVWDQDRETAIQSPRGGSKISWGDEDPERAARPGRVRFELALSGQADSHTEIDRLVQLGASGRSAHPGGRAVLLDPDGNEFYLSHRP